MIYFYHTRVKLNETSLPNCNRALIHISCNWRTSWWLRLKSKLVAILIKWAVRNDVTGKYMLQFWESCDPLCRLFETLVPWASRLRLLSDVSSVAPSSSTFSHDGECCTCFDACCLSTEYGWLRHALQETNATFNGAQRLSSNLRIQFQSSERHSPWPIN